MSNIAVATGKTLFTPGTSDHDYLSQTKINAKDKKDAINSTDYRYLVCVPKYRNEFIGELQKLQSSIDLRDAVYSNEVDEEIYKAAMQGYIEKIININYNHEKSKEAVEQIIMQTDTK